MDVIRNPQDRDRHPSARYVDRLAALVSRKLAGDRMFTAAVAEADLPGQSRLIRWSLVEAAQELRDGDRPPDA